jgi:hypothetical protein
VERDEFNERLDRLRARFAAALPQRIDDSVAALPLTSADTIDTLIVVHRKLHELCGIAPTIGFPAVGQAARAAETVLREPANSKRPLTADESSALRGKLEGLRTAARAEL